MSDHTKPVPLLSPQEVAAWLGIPVATLYQWRHARTGPRCMKVGRHLRYRVSDVDAWLDDEERTGAAGRRRR